MLRPWGFAVLLLLCAAPAMAQVDDPPTTAPQEQPPPEKTTPAPPMILPKYDISAGYTLQIFTQPNTHHLSLQGWYGTFGYHFFPWLAVEAQATGDYRHQPFPGANVSIYGAMAGPRLYPLFHHHKIEPWGHFLYGGAVFRSFFPAFGGFHSVTSTFDSRAWEVGGGVDLNFWKHWGARLIEADYERTRFNGNYNQPSYRLAIGFTYRFGKE